MSFEIPNNPHGFLFKVIDPKTNKTKGYLFGVEHSADNEMLKSLENEKVKSAFNKSINFYFENPERYVEDIDEISDQKGLENYSANIIKLYENPEPFYRLIDVPQADIELGKTLPGVDYHILMKAYNEKGKQYLHPLEDINASHHQKDATEQTIEQFQENFSSFLENSPDANHLLTPNNKNATTHTDLDIPKIVKEKNDAWKSGDIDKFTASMEKLIGDPKIEEVAYQRNREVNLARAVNELLSSKTEDKFFCVFGTNHLVSTDRVNLLSLLKARGWTIKQIK